MAKLSLDENILKLFCEDITKKKVPSVEESKLVNEFLVYMQMHNEHMKKASAYEMASTIRSFGTWYKNRNKEPNEKHPAQHRDVYYVDLGAYNIKYESGFIHPCIVIRKYGSSALVIPCSSKKYGLNDDLIYDIPKGKVFTENTGVLLEQTRSISTTRIQGKMGRLDPDTFDDIIDCLLRKYFCKKYQDFEDLKRNNKKLENELIKRDELINQLKNEIQNLKEKTVSKELIEQ